MRNNLNNIPFSDAERKYIRKYKDVMTSGAIAEDLNKLYKEYNKGTRTSDGVRAYKRELENTLIRVQSFKMCPRKMRIENIQLIIIS